MATEALARWLDGDAVYSLRRSPVAMTSAAVTLLIILAALCAPLIAPHTPFDIATLDLMDSEMPPAWIEGGDPRYLLGTDNQGRDVLSTILFGSRVSLMVGFASTLFALVLGVGLGLVSGFAGGAVDATIMRIADVKLSFPAILIALLTDGVARGLLPRDLHQEIALGVLIFAIGFAGWVQYARTVRGLTMVEKEKDYVSAARLIGVSSPAILLRHVLPNVMGPVSVIATINLGLAVLTEATLSFLGVGVPPTQPSLGTLIRIGNEFLFSGIWWITIFPAITLVALVLAINILGDKLRDALNPKLR